MIKKLLKYIDNKQIEYYRRMMQVYEVPEDFFENPDKYKDYDYYDFKDSFISLDHTKLNNGFFKTIGRTVLKLFSGHLIKSSNDRDFKIICEEIDTLIPKEDKSK